MQLVLTEDQELLAKTAADFAKEHSPVSRVRALRDAGDEIGFSQALWKEMAELGWVGIPFPETFGGADLGLAELAVVVEALGRGLAPEPFVSTVLLGGRCLLLAGTEAQRGAWLTRVVEGDAFLALAHQEARSRYDVHRIATRAEPGDGGWRIRGEKIQVLDGNTADAFVVAARTSGDESDESGISLFLVPRDRPGLSLTVQRRLDARGAALVRFEDVSVRQADLLGDEGQGGAVLSDCIEGATAILCAEMLGSMSEAFQRTVEYLKVREQFGVPIGSFQALKHRAAEMFVEIELARSAVMAATRALDEGDPEAAALVSLAKARCSDAGMLVAEEAVQMYGGIGMTDEEEIGFFLKRARVAELTFGDAAWHRERWARLAGY